MGVERVTDEQVEALFFCMIQCPKCGLNVEPDSCSDQRPDALWLCDNDGDDDGEPCNWQGTVRDLVEYRLRKIGILTFPVQQQNRESS